MKNDDTVKKAGAGKQIPAMSAFIKLLYCGIIKDFYHFSVYQFLNVLFYLDIIFLDHHIGYRVNNRNRFIVILLFPQGLVVVADKTMKPF